MAAILGVLSLAAWGYQTATAGRGWFREVVLSRE
jgi:hypothetical protein